MHRREFLKSMPAVAGSLAAAGSVAAAGSMQDCSAIEEQSSDQQSDEQRFGELIMKRTRSDHFQMIFQPKHNRPLRLLQLTDTHFHPGDETNQATEAMLKEIVNQHQPDFIVHTGDFVNNDSDKPVEWTGMDIINGLNRPWTLCFGNHDYPVRSAPGSRSLEEIRQAMQNGFQGHIDTENKRSYCYRYDVHSRSDLPPTACLFFFQVGYAEGDRRISDVQLRWFGQQLKLDLERDVKAPITVFVHIPLIEYRDLFDSGKAIGQKGEDVCFDSDTGRSFELFQKSGRVEAVFCGHDHVNNYFGPWKDIQLVYGRVSGWGGYGPKDWKRGGRLITIDLNRPKALVDFSEVYAPL